MAVGYDEPGRSIAFAPSVQGDRDNEEKAHDRPFRMPLAPLGARISYKPIPGGRNRHLRGRTDYSLCSDPEKIRNPSATITLASAAVRWGFLELGRFSVQYRRRFGEGPSETLRNALGELEQFAGDSRAAVSAWGTYRETPCQAPHTTAIVNAGWRIQVAIRVITSFIVRWGGAKAAVQCFCHPPTSLRS